MSHVEIEKDEPEVLHDWGAELANWKWDGVSIQLLQEKLRFFEDHAPGKLSEWQDTVPAEYRGEVKYVDSQSQTNSCEEVHVYVQILAVDQSGMALVYKTYLNTYTDGEGFANMAMPLEQAKQQVDEARRLASAVEG